MVGLDTSCLDVNIDGYPTSARQMHLTNCFMMDEPFFYQFVHQVSAVILLPLLIISLRILQLPCLLQA